MKFYLIFVLLFTFSSLFAEEWASSNGSIICITDYQETAGLSSMEKKKLKENPYFISTSFYDSQNIYFYNNEGSYFVHTALSCKDRAVLLDTLELVSITFESASLLSLACTGGLGVKASVAFGSFGLTLRVASLVIKQIPCDHGSDRVNENLIKQTLCELVDKEGASCELDKIKLIYKEEKKTPSPNGI